MVIIQFMHKNFEQGMKAKKHFETMINMAQYTFIFLFIRTLTAIVTSFRYIDEKWVFS